MDAFGNTLGASIAKEMGAPSAAEAAAKLKEDAAAIDSWLDEKTKIKNVIENSPKLASIGGGGGGNVNAVDTVQKYDYNRNDPKAILIMNELRGAVDSGAISINEMFNLLEENSTPPPPPLDAKLAGIDNRRAVDATSLRDATYNLVRENVISPLLSGDSMDEGKIAAATQILHDHGFRIGAREGDSGFSGLSANDKIKALRGFAVENGQLSGQFRESLSLFQSGDVAGELQDRFGVFGYGRYNNGVGMVVREVGGSTRTLSVRYQEGSTLLAEQLGISAAEAKSKTNWSTYESLLDASFATNDINSVTLSGLWRPTATRWNEYATQNNWSDDTRAQKLAAAGVPVNGTVGSEFGLCSPNNLSGLTDIYALWGDKHTIGNAIDVTMINEVAVRNGAARGSTSQPSVVKALSLNLVIEGASYIAHPWGTYNPSYDTADHWKSIVQDNHDNHLHFAR